MEKKIVRKVKRKTDGRLVYKGSTYLRVVDILGILSAIALLTFGMEVFIVMGVVLLIVLSISRFNSV